MEEVELGFPSPTLGERLIGVQYESKDDSEVVQIKRYFARVIDRLEHERVMSNAEGTLNSVKDDIIKEAMMRVADAQMWVVKAHTHGK
jgi:hypothetical protein